MRPKRYAAIADSVCTRQRSRASQRRGVGKTADPPAPRLYAAATVPFARARLEIECALRATRVRQFRGRDNRAALMFRWAIFAVHQEFAAAKQRRMQQQSSKAQC